MKFLLWIATLAFAVLLASSPSQAETPYCALARQNLAADGFKANEIRMQGFQKYHEKLAYFSTKNQRRLQWAEFELRSFVAALSPADLALAKQVAGSLVVRHGIS